MEKNLRNMFGIPMGVRVVRIRQPGEEEREKEGNEKSENFEVIKNPPYSFKQIGGYDKWGNIVKDGSNFYKLLVLEYIVCCIVSVKTFHNQFHFI